MVLNGHRNHKAYQGREEGGGGGRVWGGEYGGGGRLYTYPCCQFHNDSCIKMGSDESHFNVSLIVRDKVTRQCPQTTTFSMRKESRSGIEPRPFCLAA